ncbi:MAG: SRPBCC domain-containing protein [Pseudobdellovibrio sp.]
MAAKNKPNELYITRMYDAPVKMVWDAWVNPDKVGKWWGPRGFTITTKSKDVRTGGSWVYTMHGPDGVDWPNHTVYHEVEKYSHMIYDHGGNADQPPLFRVTVYFKEVNGKTKMDMTMTLATPEKAQEIKKFIKQAGGNSTWDRLAEFLSPVDNFVINRSFEAPIETVFEMWSNPNHLSQWLAPTGFTMNNTQADVDAGGTLAYSMSGNGVTMYGKINYKEITKPNRLVYTQIFCDKDGNISRHPMAPTWPETMLTTVIFTEEENNSTRVTITWEVYGDATSAERETFHTAKAGMTQGWTGSFDKFEDYLRQNLS